MLLIVCGVDCTGKTTLVNALSNELNFKIVKGSSFEQSQCTQDELFNRFMEMTTLEDTILDRFIYSNEVYAPEYDDFAMLDDEQRRFIEREIKGEALVIYLYANIETIKERFNTRGEEYVSIDKIEKLLENYASSISKIKNINILSYNTTYWSTDKIVDDIVKRVK